MIIEKNEFCEKIEHRYANALENESSMIDIVVDICNEYNIDLDYSKALLNRSIIEKIENEALALNMLKTKRKTHPLSNFL